MIIKPPHQLTQLTTWNSTPKIFPHQNLSQKPGHGWKVGPCRKRCKGENAGLEFDSCRRSSVENFPCPKPVGENLAVFFPNLSQLVIWSQVKISEAEIQFSSKTPQLLQGDTHVSIGVKDIFWDLYLKMTGVRQTFPTKIQVGKVFWSEGPKFRMKGLFPSCQVLGFGPTTKYLTWISARHCCQKSSHLCGPLADPQGFFHSTSRGEIIPVNLFIFGHVLPGRIAITISSGPELPHISRPVSSSGTPAPRPTNAGPAASSASARRS